MRRHSTTRALETHQRPTRLVAICSCAAATIFPLACIGCGDGRPARVPVAGTVTIDGRPLEKAFVVFYPPSGRSSSGRTDAAGRFQLRCFEENDGALLGEHRVTIIAVQELNPNTMKWFAPKKYADHKTSGLVCNIDRPRDDVKFELSWDGGKPFIERATSGD